MKKLLFVCSGNTCRSPMAAAMWQRMGGEAMSAGLSALSGDWASENAVKVMDEIGCDLRSHRSAPVTERALQWADAVYGMTDRHAMHLARFFPAYAEKVRVMPIEIPDPFGGDEDDYRVCADRIRTALGMILSGEGA